MGYLGFSQTFDFCRFMIDVANLHAACNVNSKQQFNTQGHPIQLRMQSVVVLCAITSSVSGYILDSLISEWHSYDDQVTFLIFLHFFRAR